MRNRFNYSGFPDITRPQWAGRDIQPADMLPGGAKLDDTIFTAYTNPVTVALTAAGNIGDVTLAVGALAFGIPAGVQLNFGAPVQQAFVIAAAVAGATTLQIAPLVQPIANLSTAVFRGQYGIMVPAGTLVSRTFAQRAAGGSFHPAIDPTSVVTTTGAAATAVALPVTALTRPIPAGTVLFINGEEVNVTTAAAVGAVSLVVAPLGVAVGAGSTTFLSPEDEYFLTAFDVRDLTLDNDVSLCLRDGRFPVKENFLPNYYTLAQSAALLAILRAGYACTLGV